MGTSKLSRKPDECCRVTCDALASYPGGVAILLVALGSGSRATRLIRLNLRTWDIMSPFCKAIHAKKTSLLGNII